MTTSRCPPAVAGLAIALGLAGCAAEHGAERPRRPQVKPGEFGTPDCFAPHLVRNFTTLDDRNLIVYGPGKSDAYHVQVFPPSRDLRFAGALAFGSHGSRVCGRGGDDLTVAGAEAQSRVAVVGVWRLDERALQGLRARFGQAAPAGVPRPEPGQGAEIERELGQNAQP